MGYSALIRGLIRLWINPCAQVRRPFGSAIANDLADCLQRKEALMKVMVRREGDRERLDTLIAREKVAVQRDRLRAARLALDGGEASEIAVTLGRSRRFVPTPTATEGSRRSGRARAAAGRPSCRGRRSKRSAPACWAALPKPTGASARFAASTR